MLTIQPGDQVVRMTPDGEKIEAYIVVKARADGVQVDGTSGRLSRQDIRGHSEDVVKGIREKERQLGRIKREMRSLYQTLDRVC